MTVPLSDDEKKDILRRRDRGESQRSIGTALGRSQATVNAFLRQHAEIPGLPALSATGVEQLGPSVIRWASEHSVLVSNVRERMLRLGWEPQTATVVILALASTVREELARQTGGKSPTMRAALYRAMGVYGAVKALYTPLAVHTAHARHRGLFLRDFWSDPEPSEETAPGWWTAEEALRGRLWPVGRPSDGFHGVGHVFGVVLETRGAAEPMRGALKQKFGFRIPLWPTGGQAPIPRLLHIEQEMLRWAEKAGEATPHVLLVTDHDASGLVIGQRVDEQLDVDVIRIGMTPDLAREYGAPDAADLDEDEDKADKKTHRKTQVWKDAVEEYGEVEYQAEALDYATWAEEIAKAMGEVLEADGTDLADLGVEHDPQFDRVDAFLAALEDRLDMHGGDVGALADDLGLEVEP